MSLKDKVIGVDLDGTLSMDHCWTPEECLRAKVNGNIADWVHEMYQKNFIVIYTARRDENIPATLEWLRRNNIRYHAISNNKTPLDVLVDDVAIHPTEISPSL